MRARGCQGFDSGEFEVEPGIRAAKRNPRRMTLRWFLALALVAAMSVPATSAFASPTNSSTTTSYYIDRLEAHWILPRKSRAGVFPYFVVLATRRTNADTGEVTVSGVAGRGSCGARALSCYANLKSGWRVLKFETDDAFATATVVLRRGDKRARVSWMAGVPYPVAPPYAENPSICDDGSEGRKTTVYLSSKNATAEGKVLGRSVSSSAEHADEGAAERMIQTYDTEECA